MKIVSLVLLAIAAVAASPAAAAMTEWQDLGGGKARLAAQMNPADGSVEGVIEVQLLPGWKTYWREPGGSGMPPQFEFGASTGFIAGPVQFPLPQLLKAGGSSFAGYEGQVRFPFRGEALSSTGQIILDALIGVCEEICIPANARFEIALSSLNVSDPQTAILVADAKAMLPGEPREGLKAIGARFERPHQLTVDVELPQTAAEPQVFVEGEPGWHFGQAEMVSATEGKASFRVTLIGRPRVEAGETGIRVTLVAGASGVEQELRVETPKAE